MRGKRRKIALCMLLACIFFLGSGSRAAASDGTTYTYTISVDGDYVRTQEAYLASTVYMQRQGLLQPNDLFVLGDEIYIADTGNKRIVVFHTGDGSTREIVNEAFAGPSGLFVTEERIYVADSAADDVFVCDNQ